MSETVEPLTQEEFASWAQDLRPKFLRCRDLGHRWAPLTAWWDEESRVFVRANRCSDCTTGREQVLDYLGRIQGTRYEYPEGYSAPPGVGRLDADDRGTLRLVAIRRILNKKPTK